MIDEVVTKYVALRDRKAELKKEFDEKTKELDAAMGRCELFLLRHMQEQGAKSISTPGGTAYIQTRTSASVADWDSFLAFVRSNDMWSMLERRANKTAVEQYREAEDDLPPGLNWREEQVVNIRRS